MPQPKPTMPPRSRHSAVLGWLLLLFGIAGFAAVWVLLSLFTGKQNSWMAVLGALDVVWMLRLGGGSSRRGRVISALIGTTAIVILANWGITAGHLGEAFGLQPWESAMRLGASHAWTIAQLANGPMDLFWILLALAIAALIASRKP